MSENEQEEEKEDADYDLKAEEAMRKEEERLGKESQRRRNQGSNANKSAQDAAAAANDESFKKLEWFMKQSKVDPLILTSAFHCFETDRSTFVGFLINSHDTDERSIGQEDGRNHSTTEACIRRQDARLPVRRSDMAYLPL